MSRLLSVLALWRNDKPTGYGVMVSMPADDWEALVLKVATAASNATAALAEIREMAGRRDPDQGKQITFAALVAIAVERGWMRDDNFNGTVIYELVTA